jgi:hypothetical protein
VENELGAKERAQGIDQDIKRLTVHVWFIRP